MKLKLLSKSLKKRSLWQNPMTFQVERAIFLFCPLCVSTPARDKMKFIVIVKVSNIYC